MLDSLFQIISTQLPRFSPSDRQGMLDDIDKMILESILLVAEECLGSYEVFEAKQRPDFMPSKLGRSSSIQDAIRLYKRGFRMKGINYHIESRSSDITPIEDVVQFFSEVFSQLDESLLIEDIHS